MRSPLESMTSLYGDSEMLKAALWLLPNSVCGQIALMPPSISNSLPTLKADSSDAK
jgi:hypothetical protein